MKLYKKQEKYGLGRLMAAKMPFERVNEMTLDFRTKLLMTVVISLVLLFCNLQGSYPILGLIVTFLP